MTEPRRPSRRRTPAVADQPSAAGVDVNPYRDDDAAVGTAAPNVAAAAPAPTPEADADVGAADTPARSPRAARAARPARRPRAARGEETAAFDAPSPDAPTAASSPDASNDLPATSAPATSAPAASAPAASAPAASAPTNGARAERMRPETSPASAPAAESTPAAPAPPVPQPAINAPAADSADATPAPYAARPQEQQGRPNPRHEGRHDGRRDNRHDGRQPRHERFDRTQDRAQQQDRPSHDRHGAPDRSNGTHAGTHGSPDAHGGQPQRRGEFFEGGGGGRRQRHRQRGRFRDGNPVGNNGGSEFREQRPVPALIADTDVTGWVELARDGSGFVRQAANSYLAGPNDPFLPVAMVRANNLRAGDGVAVGAGRDFRQRPVVVEVRTVNGAPPQPGVKRPDFQSLLATYPDRKLTLETGKVAKSGPELTRRIIDLIAPIGFGQRALIVAPARSGKTILLQNIVEGVALNHPTAELILLLVDERPEEVSEMVACGYGEVVASSFDMPAERHRDVVTMVMHRAQRLVEAGKDVVIVLDSITRMARAFNATKGIGRTLSGGLDAQAMAVPKAFFGSARSVAGSHGGGSITIIGTALVETGSRMDDVIFEEFKGTGNCEIKLDRNLAEQRIFPAIDVPASGTRREDKLFRPEQLDAVYLLRRGLQSLPPSAAMNWLQKRIANTPNNDVLLATLKDT
ncbi:MAG TPA: transcription termination factor Rho [Gemmatirosa sp.]